MMLLGAASDLTLAVLVCLALIVGTWLVSNFTGNHSQVDRLWSVAPPAYAILFAAATHFTNLRVDLAAALVTLWGVRLTYNFWRKGGYRRGSEDYRWAVLRARLGPTGFAVFNATFIAPFQNVLLLALAFPVWCAAHGTRPLGWLDALAAVGFVVLLCGETIADRQQWDFHAEKARRQAAGEPGPAFLTTGFFRYSRHPNFFCEISLWWCVWLFSVAAGVPWYTGIACPVTLTLLFQGSTTMTERITRAKYAAYAEYQRTTSRLVPLP